MTLAQMYVSLLPVTPPAPHPREASGGGAPSGHPQPLASTMAWAEWALGGQPRGARRVHAQRQHPVQGGGAQRGLGHHCAAAAPPVLHALPE